MKDHEIAQLVNHLKEVAVQYGGSQQLRERLSDVVCAAIEAALQSQDHPNRQGRVMDKLFCDLKTDEEKAAFFLSGRGYETGVISQAIQNDVAMAYHRCVEYKKELEALQSQDREIEFQLEIEGEIQAQTFGPREQAWAEIQRYAAQYAEDGPVEIWEITRRRIEGDG